MMSSKVRIAAVLAGLLLAAPALSFAQGPGGGRGGFGGGFGGRGGGGISGLLRMEEVQKEISVTDEQKAELTKISEAGRGAGGGAAGFDREAFQKLTEDERNNRLEEMRKEGEERTKKADEAIKAMLKPEQWTRLSELRTQREGVRALSREEVQKELALTEEQIAKVKTLTDAQNAGGFGGGRNFQDMSEEEMRKAREEMTAKREAFDKDMAAVLTEEQKATWTKMQGAKFEFPQRGGPGGGGPGGAGGGRRRPE